MFFEKKKKAYQEEKTEGNLNRNIDGNVNRNTDSNANYNNYNFGPTDLLENEMKNNNEQWQNAVVGNEDETSLLTEDAYQQLYGQSDLNKRTGNYSSNQPNNSGQPGYSSQASNSNQSGYSGQSGYLNQSGHSVQTGYSGQMGYSGQSGYGNATATGSNSNSEYSNYDDDEDNEGETSLLSPDAYQQYLGEQVKNDRSSYGAADNGNQNNGNVYTEQRSSQEYNPEYEPEEDTRGETTLLSNDTISIPAGTRRAYLIRIISGERISINKALFIMGSQNFNTDYQIPNPSVSRKHAYIVVQGGKYFIVDNKSTNKTMIDGVYLEPLKQTELYNGALIQLSDELFQFMYE